MSPGIGVGVGLPFVHLQRRSSSILDQLFGGGQGMYAVAGLRGKNLITKSERSISDSGFDQYVTDHGAIAGPGTITFANAFEAPASPAGDPIGYWAQGSATSAGYWMASVYTKVLDGGAALNASVLTTTEDFTMAVASVGGGASGVVVVYEEDVGNGWRRHGCRFLSNGAGTSGGVRIYAAQGYRNVLFAGYMLEPCQSDTTAPSAYEKTTGTALYGAWLDQTGGGRHLTLPGGSANPIQLDHDGTDYFYFPGTTGNTLTVPGLSNSTAYDYKVWYEDATTATGEETTDGSGVLTLGGTQTNFDAKSVTRIRVVADGDDPDVDTAVADILASDADEDSSTFTEASSNAATVTINRSASGYKTVVVQRAKSVTATDDYMCTALDAMFAVGAGESVTYFWMGTVHGTNTAHVLAANDSGIYIRNTTSPEYYGRVNDGSDIVTDTSSGASRGVRVVLAARLDRSSNELEFFVNGVGTGSPSSTTAVGALLGSTLYVGALSSITQFADAEHEGIAWRKTALTDEQIAAVGAALLALNSGG